MMGLTRRQRDLLDFIGAYMATENVAPSFEEMKAGLGLKSKSGIHRLIDSLEERGFVQRLPNRARAIDVLKTPRPVLQTVVARPLLREDTDTLIAEMKARGFHVERAAA